MGVAFHDVLRKTKGRKLYIQYLFTVTHNEKSNLIHKPVSTIVYMFARILEKMPKAIAKRFLFFCF